MKNMTQAIKLTAIAAALLAVYGPVHAEDDEVKALTKPDSSISVGVGHWSEDRPHQGIFDGMRDAGGYGLLDADVVKRDDASGTWYTFSARNLGLENRELSAEYLRQGNIGASIEYSRTLRDNPHLFLTGLQGIGTTTQVVNGTSGNRSPLREVELGTARDSTKLSFYKNLVPGLDFNVSFRNEEKNGDRLWGRGGAPEFVTEPIDSTTREIEAVLNYTGERLQLSGGYNGSWYDTKNTLVDTLRRGESPATMANHMYLSLPLDNEAHQFFLDGGYNFTPSTRGRFKVEYTHATQNERLPTSGIAGLAFSGAPSKLKGEINTTLVQLGLTSQVTRDLSLGANLRYHDADDETPVRRYMQDPLVLTDAQCGTVISGQARACVDNTPFSYKTLSGKLEGTYRLPQGFSLTGGYEQREEDRWIPVSNANGTGGTDTQRVVPMRSDVDEKIYRLQLRKALSESLGGSLGFVRSDRDGSDYLSAAAGPGGAPSDRINPINIADRERDKWRLALDWSPVQPLSVQFVYEHSRDDYDHDPFRSYGLRDGSAELYSLDVSYAFSDSWKMSAWYSKDVTKAKQFGQRAEIRNRNTNALELRAAEKEADLSDHGDTLGLSLRGAATSKLRLGADFQLAFNRSKYKETLIRTAPDPVPATAAEGPLPDIDNRLTTFKLFAEYALRKDAELRFDFIHERWKTDDWTWQFANGTQFVYTGTGANANAFTDGTMVIANSRQTANFVGARYIYKFQ